MNVQDVYTRVQRTFGDEAAVQVNSDDIIRWINDATVEIIKHNDGALQKTDFIDLVAGQSSYVMPADLLLVRSIRFKYATHDSYRLVRYKNMQQFDEEVDGWDGNSYPASHPRFFTMYENKVILFPTPDESATEGLKILYNRKPVDVTDVGDDLPLPLLYHNTIVTYCLWQASLLDEDHEPGMMYQSKFNNDMGLLAGTETKDPVATYPVITVLPEDL